MLLMVVGFILINWMLVVAWIDPARSHFIFWALIIILVWWFAWRRRNPPFPLQPQFRVLVYLIFLFETLPLVFLIGRLSAMLVPLEILALWGLEAWLKRRAEELAA